MSKHAEKIIEAPEPDSWELNNVDGEEVSDVLKKVEKSFGFQFAKHELKDVKTFGELCDIIVAKVQGDHRNDCSTQQAFYKLRETFAEVASLNKEDIKLDIQLRDLFPKAKRKQRLELVEARLGFKLNVLQPKDWLSTSLVLLFLASLVLLFIDWKIGLGGTLFFLITNRIVTKTANEIDSRTIRDLAYKLTRDNYQMMRRHPGTINRNEIAEQIKMLFADELDLALSVLHRDATF